MQHQLAIIINPFSLSPSLFWIVNSEISYMRS